MKKQINANVLREKNLIEPREYASQSRPAKLIILYVLNAKKTSITTSSKDSVSN